MTELLSVTGPVFTVGGQLERRLADTCVRLVVSEGVEGLRTLEAVFAGTGIGAPGPPGDLLHFDGTTVDLGSDLQVAIGPDSAQQTAFDGTVSAMELEFGDGGVPRVTVLAEDRLMRLRMTRRMRSWTDLTDADLARRIAQEHGLDADASVSGPTYDVLQQANQSDLAFLRERARLVQAEIWCTGRTLHFRERQSRPGTRLTLVQPSDLLTVRLVADLAHQRTDVAVSGYDARRKAVIDEHAGPDTVRAEALSGRTGPEVLRETLGASASFRVREAPLTTAEARAWARAEMLRRSRRFVTVRGVTNGSPDLGVGSVLRLVDVGAPFSGDGYYVTRATQTWDTTHGLRTAFEAERATLSPRGGA